MSPQLAMELGPPIRHLLVDLDGTLLGNKSVPLQIDFVGRALKSLKQYGGLKKRMKALLAVHTALRSPSKDVTNDVRAIAVFSKLMEISQDEGKKLLRETIGVIFPALERHFYPMPGAKDFLGWARDHYPLTLATNPVWPKEIVQLRLRWAGVDPDTFGRLTLVNQMHACKPEPMYYEEILAQEKLSPEECLLIGDDVRMDLPATRVGIRVFIVDGEAKPDKIGPLRFAGARALAWRGTYPILRRSLEMHLQQGDNPLILS